MSVETLVKKFWSKDQSETIEIKCSYDYLLCEISQVEVKVMDNHTGHGFNMTSVWEQEPFLSLVDDIDWHTIYEETYYS